MLERHELEAFLTLGDELHFGRTAELLGVSTGRISQTIRKLERRVGTPLFARTSRSVRLTPVGRRLHEELRPAHRQILAALERATTAGRGMLGTLRVGFASPWGGALLTAAADAFLADHPGCAITLREVPLDVGTRPVEDGELDLQYATFPAAAPGLTAGPVLIREDRVLLVAAAHPLAGRASVGLDDLAGETLVTSGAGHPRAWREAHYPTRTPSGAAVRHGPSAATWEEVLSLVGAGRGVSPGAARGARYHPRPGIVYVPFHDAPPLEYGLVWATAAESALIRAFTETAARVPAEDGGTPGLR
ncbi:LysR family transcriptional regulator [Streptomyces showdoensis]|uniref:LysR family transcriptional regulator n=1 Tax=Streptomyces showdoensis TaxID=68268 RepID=A0A2P2GEJ8_STREW|nr:LysR family transcriptional regulator [Streptomyces showdoensis]KKZ69932.1 LysR family transcriptional regulator [Streptomyces showdoensis]